MRSHHPGRSPLTLWLLPGVAACVMLKIGWAADEPAPPRIVMIRGEQRSEYTLSTPGADESAAPSDSTTEVESQTESASPVVEFDVEPEPFPADSAAGVTLDVPPFAEPQERSAEATLAVPLRSVPAPGEWSSGEQEHPRATHFRARPVVLDWSAAAGEPTPTSDPGPRENGVAAVPSASLVEVRADEPEGDHSEPVAADPARGDDRANSDPGVQDFEAVLTPTGSSQFIAPARPLSQTTILKFDAVQAGWIGAGILLCLLCQVAVIVVLVRQRSRQPQPMVLHEPAGRMAPMSHRATSVVDFNAGVRLFDGGGEHGDRERHEVRQREAMIIEELVSMNVKLAPELSQS